MKKDILLIAIFVVLFVCFASVIAERDKLEEHNIILKKGV